MPSVGASVNGISDSLVFLRLVVEVVKEVEKLLARVDGGVMAQKREVRVVLRVVDVEVERHVAGIALEQHLQVVHARVVEQGGVDVDGEPLYALVLHVVHEFHALDDQLQAVGRVGVECAFVSTHPCARLSATPFRVVCSHNAKKPFQSGARER